MAWASTRYLTDPQIQAMEVVARRERLGLWADAHPMPPWEWRKAGEKGIASECPLLGPKRVAIAPINLGSEVLARCYFATFREAKISTAWVLLNPRSAAIAAQ